jgi:DNA polymerase
MTSEEKQSLALFLDTAADSFRDGYRRNREQHLFTNEEKKLSASVPLPDSTPTGDSLEQIAAEIQSCTRCSLCKTRKKTVPGEGVQHPLVMVSGEGPGADEAASGRPFVGPAGQLLDRMLDSRGQIGLSRNTNCFIANTVKCRPPGNRDPLPEETAACAAFLERQITLLSPKIILCAGRISAHIMLKTEESMGKLRGKFFQFPIPNSQTPNSKLQIPLLATYHPSALLRNEDYKKPSWEDLQLLRSKLAELDPGYADTVRQWVKNGDA